MKRILTTLSKKWPEYMLEILVITIGVLGAFALNNWNEDSKNRTSETYYLNNLLDNLKSDSTQLERLIRNVYIVREQIDSVNQMLMDENLYRQDPFLACLNALIMTSDFNQNRETFDNLLATGKIEAIKNDSLVNLLFEYYDAGRSSVHWDDANIHYSRNVFGPLILKTGRFSASDDENWTDDEISYDYRSFKMNLELRNSLNLKYVQTTVQLDNYQTIELPRLQQICELIRQELKAD
jgi:hypothetical protein